MAEDGKGGTFTGLQQCLDAPSSAMSLGQSTAGSTSAPAEIGLGPLPVTMTQAVLDCIDVKELCILGALNRYLCCVTLSEIVQRRLLLRLCILSSLHNVALCSEAGTMR